MTLTSKYRNQDYCDDDVRWIRSKEEFKKVAKIKKYAQEILGVSLMLQLTLIENMDEKCSRKSNIQKGK